MMSGGLLVHGIAYLELPPQEPHGYICTYTDGSTAVCGEDTTEATWHGYGSGGGGSAGGI